MSENPLQGVCQTVDKISQCVQTHLSHFTNSMFGINNNNYNYNYNTNKNSSSLIQNTITTSNTTASVLLHSNHEITTQRSKAQPVSKEELGRCTWTFLHTLGAQYPDKPTRQQRRDAKELMEILSRMYPCKDCADHFKEVLRSNPVQAGSQAELSQWLCHVHNVVNRSLGKVTFQCERVDARWGKLECDQRACDLQGTISFGDDLP